MYHFYWAIFQALFLFSLLLLFFDTSMILVKMCNIIFFPPFLTVTLFLRWFFFVRYLNYIESFHSSHTFFYDDDDVTLFDTNELKFSVFFFIPLSHSLERGSACFLGKKYRKKAFYKAIAYDEPTTKANIM